MAQLKAGTTINGRDVMQEFDSLIARIGNNEDLNTTQKATLILAINEINSKANSNESSINDISDSISQLADMISGLGNDLTTHEDKTVLDDVHGLLSGGHVIEEYGENENGEYIRFSNGFQICRFTDAETTQVEDDISDGVYFNNKTFSFPASFIETPTVTPTSLRTSFVQWAGLRDATSTTVDLYIMGYNSSASGYLGYIAIGRWK